MEDMEENKEGDKKTGLVTSMEEERQVWAGRVVNEGERIQGKWKGRRGKWRSNKAGKKDGKGG